MGSDPDSYRPNPKLLRPLLDAARHRLPRLDARQVATILWACSRLDCEAPDVFIDKLVDAAQLRLPELSQESRQMCQHAVARLGIEPQVVFVRVTRAERTK